MTSPSVLCDSPYLKLVEGKPLTFWLAREIPEGLSPQIQDAVRDFMVSSHLPQGVNLEGFYQQTLQSIAAASYLNQGGDLWLGTIDNQLVIYLLANISNIFDNRLAYMVSQAWVRKDQRGQRWVKEVWEEVRQRAKNCLCAHFGVYSSRGKTKAYCRFLGKGFHPYAEILKEEF